MGENTVLILVIEENLHNQKFKKLITFSYSKE